MLRRFIRSYCLALSLCACTVAPAKVDYQDGTLAEVNDPDVSSAEVQDTHPASHGKFYAIEAVSAFAAKIAADGSVVARVCGAVLDPNDPTLPAEPGPGEANGFEVTANFISSNLDHPPCPGDQDTAIKEGETIEGTPLKVGNGVTADNFQFTQRCDSANSDKAPCNAGAQTLSANAVSYRNIAGRCDPTLLEATRLNIALVIDNSGSMKGNVDKETHEEDAAGTFDPSPQPLTNVASDWNGYRFNAVESFIASLNSSDRVIGYLAGEAGPQVASSDSFICSGSNTPADDGPCRPEDAKTCPSPGTCDMDPTMANDSYAIGLENAECLAFGADPSKRIDLNNGLELRRNSANGRAALWQTIDTAFSVLVGGNTKCPTSGLSARHIIVINDGPDTCVDSDDFAYTSLKNMDTSGKCRVKCANSDVGWRNLVVKMAKSSYPVHVHFIQFQAPGYKDPDPRQVEMACRTDGTYQFITSENFNKSAGTDFSNALTRAVARARNGLSGTWRVGFKSPTPLPTGELMAIDGDLVFTDTKFASLDPAVTKLSPDSWRFTANGAEDRRALMRIACTTDSDCGGTNTCAAKHCGEGGVCRVAAAPNGRPCPGGTCSKGTCVAGEKCADAIKP